MLVLLLLQKQLRHKKLIENLRKLQFVLCFLFVCHFRFHPAIYADILNLIFFHSLIFVFHLLNVSNIIFFHILAIIAGYHLQKKYSFMHVFFFIFISRQKRKEKKMRANSELDRRAANSGVNATLLNEF